MAYLKGMSEMKITKNQFDILDYTIYRAANGHFCGDSDDMQRLIELGLMRYVGKTAFCPDRFFGITRSGRKVTAANFENFSF